SAWISPSFLALQGGQERVERCHDVVDLRSGIRDRLNAREERRDGRGAHRLLGNLRERLVDRPGAYLAPPEIVSHAFLRTALVLLGVLRKIAGQIAGLFRIFWGDQPRQPILSPRVVQSDPEAVRPSPERKW